MAWRQPFISLQPKVQTSHPQHPEEKTHAKTAALFMLQANAAGQRKAYNATYRTKEI